MIDSFAHLCTFAVRMTLANTKLVIISPSRSRFPLFHFPKIVYYHPKSKSTEQVHFMVLQGPIWAGCTLVAKLGRVLKPLYFRKYTWVPFDAKLACFKMNFGHPTFVRYFYFFCILLGARKVVIRGVEVWLLSALYKPMIEREHAAQNIAHFNRASATVVPGG